MHGNFKMALKLASQKNSLFKRWKRFIKFKENFPIKQFILVRNNITRSFIRWKPWAAISESLFLWFISTYSRSILASKVFHSKDNTYFNMSHCNFLRLKVKFLSLKFRKTLKLKEYLCCKWIVGLEKWRHHKIYI